MIIFVDIDETICNTPGNKTQARDYSLAKPIQENINKVNSLYDNGHKIIYWTARGTVSGIDWTKTTVEQLKTWGVKYTEVKLGKPNYDVFICDKAINTSAMELLL